MKITYFFKKNNFKTQFFKLGRYITTTDLSTLEVSLTLARLKTALEEFCNDKISNSLHRSNFDFFFQLGRGDLDFYLWDQKPCIH